MLFCQKLNLISEYNTAETILTMNDLVQGWQTSTHRKAPQFVKDLSEGHTCVYIHLKGGRGIEFTRIMLFMNNKLH